MHIYKEETFTFQDDGVWTIPISNNRRHPPAAQNIQETSLIRDRVIVVVQHTWDLNIRGVHISMGKFQSGFLKKHIIFPGCICFPDYKNIRVEHFDPGK